MMRSTGTVALAVLLIASCKEAPPPIRHTELTPEVLTEHSKIFKQQVVQVAEGVHVAIGFGLANSILIEGDDGLIIIDAMESMEAGEEVRRTFRDISDLPVKAIIYTHNHTDHVFGAQALAGDDAPMVIAHELMPVQLDKVATVIRPVIEKRSYRMFGNFLPQEERVNCGIGPELHISKDTELGVIRPTYTFSDTAELEIAGVTLKLFHAPGETPDQLAVWLPDRRILCIGDNYYHSFPNLYTIRGTAYRDLNVWKSTLDRLRRLPADILLPSHTRPVYGADSIHRVLTDYRDAIQFVHDQTVRYMNKGMTPDQIVERVILPPHLRAAPYLQELYGRVDWTVRSVFNGYLGWFDGNPTELYPLAPEELARRVLELAEGRDDLESAAKKALKAGEERWALWLTDRMLALDPESTAASDIRFEALQKLGMAEANPNARHYFLTSARELRGLENEGLVTPGEDMVHAIPMRAIFDGMATFLNADKAQDVEKTVVFRFPDTGEEFSVIVRRGVAEIQPYAVQDPDHVVTADAYVWKEVAAEIRSAEWAFATGKIRLEGGIIRFKKFMDLFDR